MVKEKKIYGKKKLIGAFSFLFLFIVAALVLGATSVSALDTRRNVDLDLEYTARIRTQDGDQGWLVQLNGDARTNIFLPFDDPDANQVVTPRRIVVGYSFNESEYCTSSQSVISQYVSLTSTMGDMLDVCKSTVTQFNATQAYMNELSEAREKQTEFESLWNVEKSRREQFEENFVACEETLERVESERDQYRSTASIADSRTASLRECEEDLEDCESAKTTQLILGIGLGLAGGYFFWGRNKSGASSYGAGMPSEHEEAEQDYY